MRTTEGGAWGYDGGERVAGRKRRLLVDTEGLLTEPAVQPADHSEGAGARPVLVKAKVAGRAVGRVRVDGGYQAGVAA